ncbi:MAG TPA: YetF domain-containing protein [Gemmatimonadaceae bacterium]|nr:YetF domain-containing protein [Gemmatimonadaceae bacterium]
MDTMLRGAAIYVFLLIVFRVAGKRTLTQITTFDFVLLLIISEAVQQSLIATDNSLTNAVMLVLTLVGLDILLSLVKQRVPRLERLMEGAPVVIVEDGMLHRDRMAKERVDEADILAAARERQGLARLDQIAYAVVERSGGITIVPRKNVE